MKPESVLNEDGFVHVDLLMPIELHDALVERAMTHDQSLHAEVLLTLLRSIRASNATAVRDLDPDDELQRRIANFLKGP